MSGRFPSSQHQRPPPPYPSGGGRGSGPRGGGTYSSRGRGGSYGAAAAAVAAAASHSAHPVVTSATASTAASSTPTTTAGSTSAPPLVQTQTSAQLAVAAAAKQATSTPQTSTTQSSTSQSSTQQTSAQQTSAQQTSAQQTSANESKILSNPNPVCLCKIGQGTIQDIVSMTQELFTYLKMITPANTTTLAAPVPVQGVLPIALAQEKSSKAEEHLKEINLLFKKLKVIYKNLQPIPNDDQGAFLLDIDKTEDLIPMKKKRTFDDKEIDADEILRKKKFESQAYMQAARELAEVKENLRRKNAELKSIIDDTRTTVWEINSMLGMRKLGS